MKRKVVALLLTLMLTLTPFASAFASDSSSETEEPAEASEAAGEEAPGSFTLPVPVIDEAYLDKDDEGKTIIVVKGTPHEELAAIDQYLAENKSYPIGVEFYVNVNNEGFVKTASRGEKASEGVYSCDLPASFTGKSYLSSESYFQIQMRYVYDYDWIRVTQSEWSNTLEINSQLSGIDLQKKAETAGVVTTLLWVGGIAVLAVLFCVVLIGGDKRCPDCRGRVPHKQTVCPRCGYDFKTKKSGPPKAETPEQAEQASDTEQSE